MIGQKQRIWGSRAGIGERAYAAHAGISRGAVQKARRSGRLVLHPDGSVDAAASDARRAGATDPVRSENALMQPELRAGAGTEAPAEDVPGRANHTTYVEARTAHELFKAEERRIRVGKLRGELVDRALAADLVFRLARRERDSWLLWPVRVAAADGRRTGRRRPPPADGAGARDGASTLAARTRARHLRRYDRRALNPHIPDEALDR